MKQREGTFVIIARDGNYKLIEVSFKGENKPLYKVYKGNQLLDKFYDTEKLSEMPADMVEESTPYLTYLDIMEEEEEKDSYKKNRYYGYNNPIYGQNKTVSNSSSYSSKEYADYLAKIEAERKKRELGTTGLAKDLKKSDTLVIHCADKSTEMLSQMYEGKNYDVLRDGSINKDELHELLNCHKRIIMLGHGTGGGLINVQSSKGGSWCVIGAPEAPLLKDKQLFVIWCNADAYFNTHHIGEGQFITGNMPSEVWECRAAGCGDISAQEMLDNITYWSKLCGDVTERCLNGDVASSVRYIREEYIKKYGDHPVTVYNSVRTKVHGTSMEQNEREVEEIYKKLGKEVPKVKQPSYSSYGGYGSYGSYGGRGIFDLNNDEQDD